MYVRKHSRLLWYYGTKTLVTGNLLCCIKPCRSVTLEKQEMTQLCWQSQCTWWLSHLNLVTSLLTPHSLLASVSVSVSDCSSDEVFMSPVAPVNTHNVLVATQTKQSHTQQNWSQFRGLYVFNLSLIGWWQKHWAFIVFAHVIKNWHAWWSFIMFC